MGAVIKYCWLSNKESLWRKFIIKALVLLFGILVVNLTYFNDLFEKDLSVLLEEGIFFLLMIGDITIFLSCYEKIRTSGFDRYVVASSMSYSKYVGSLAVFDVAISLSSVLGWGMYFVVTRGILDIHLVSFCTSLRWLGLVYGIKLVNIICMQILNSMKNVILTDVAIYFIINRFSAYSMLIQYSYIIVLVSVVIYVLLEKVFQYLWEKEG